MEKRFTAKSLVADARANLTNSVTNTLTFLPSEFHV